MGEIVTWDFHFHFPLHLLFCPEYFAASMFLLLSPRCAGFHVKFSPFSLYCPGFSWIGEVFYWNFFCSNFEPLRMFLAEPDFSQPAHDNISDAVQDELHVDMSIYGVIFCDWAFLATCCTFNEKLFTTGMRGSVKVTPKLTTSGCLWPQFMVFDLLSISPKSELLWPIQSTIEIDIQKIESRWIPWNICVGSFCFVPILCHCKVVHWWSLMKRIHLVVTMHFRACMNVFHSRFVALVKNILFQFSISSSNSDHKYSLDIIGWLFVQIPCARVTVAPQKLNIVAITRITSISRYGIRRYAIEEYGSLSKYTSYCKLIVYYPDIIFLSWSSLNILVLKSMELGTMLAG